MLLSAVSVLVVTQSISEIPEGLTNNPVFVFYTAASFHWAHKSQLCICSYLNESNPHIQTQILMSFVF